MRTLSVLALCTVVALPARAQTGTFAGTVERDTAGNVVGRAEVQLPQLSRVTVTNIAGQFQFSDVPAGRYAVAVRAIGFELFVDSVDIGPGARVDGDIILTPTAIALAAQHTTAVAVPKRLPFGLQEMEDRRKTHLGGYFVTDSMLRANDERRLPYFLAGIPAIRQVLEPGGSAIFLTNGRLPPHPPCYIAVYLNGAKINMNPPPDFNTFWASEYSGIEYYPGGSSMPAEYGGTGNGCGVILLWTRQ